MRTIFTHYSRPSTIAVVSLAAALSIGAVSAQEGAPPSGGGGASVESVLNDECGVYLLNNTAGEIVDGGSLMPHA